MGSLSVQQNILQGENIPNCSSMNGNTVVGQELGHAVGFLLGCLVGCMVGFFDGCLVGSTVG